MPSAKPSRRESRRLRVTVSSAIDPPSGAFIAPASGLSAPDRAALLERLYRAHAPRVFGVCLRMTGDRVRATELAQDVFVRAWDKIDLLRDEANAGAWLARVATNVVLNARRAERRRWARVEPMEDVAAVAVVSLRTPVPVRRMELAAAMDRLPERARRVYALHDVEGYSHGEVATMLGVASGTVRAQLHRARQLMRKALLG